MNLERAKEIADYMSKHALRSHFVQWASGGGHGMPFHETIWKSCPCVIHNGSSVTGVDETAGCNCGATQHNAMIKELAQILTPITNERDATKEHVVSVAAQLKL